MGIFQTIWYKSLSVSRGLDRLRIEHNNRYPNSKIKKLSDYDKSSSCIEKSKSRNKILVKRRNRY